MTSTAFGNTHAQCLPHTLLGMERRVTVREAAFELFRAFKMTTVFGNPGSTELPMFRDFPDDFRYALALQESIAVGMADGYAQATRNAALVSLHSAAGLGHALGNVFTAAKNQTPLVIIAGQQARSILPFEPFLYAKDAAEFPRPYIKWSCEPARAEDVPAAIARAYYTAMQSPCGPTFISVPVDDWDRSCVPVTPRQVSRTICGDQVLLEETAAALDRAERPVFIVGAALARDGAWDETIALAERHRAPVWVAPMSSRNSFPENHPQFAGFLPPDRHRIVEQLSAHDFVLVLGAPVFTYHIEGTGPHAPAGITLVQLIDDPTAAAWAPVGTAIVTGLKAGVGELLRQARPRQRSTPTLRPRPTKPPTRLTDAYLMQQIAEQRPAGSIIVEEAPSTRPPMHDYLPITEPDTFYTCASGGLGHGLPAAIGMAMGRPDRKVIAILGDGSSMYSIQGLWSAAQAGLPVAFIIVKNGSYQALNEFGDHFGIRRLPGVALPALDFCGLARGQGVSALSVKVAEELEPALQVAFRSPGPMLVEVHSGLH
jgi:benzoylformate decarboxylase